MDEYEAITCTEIVVLTDEQTAFADKVTQWRIDNAVANNRVARNNQPHDRALRWQHNLFGTRCEAAAKIYFNPIQWLAYQPYGFYGKPDLGSYIDVKGVDKPHHSLIVQFERNGGHKDWVYVLVDATFHPTYSIIGWCWGEEVMIKKYEADPVGGRAAYFIDRDDPIVKPPCVLHDAIHEYGYK